MSYTPNFNDPRVVKRITHALGFASASLTTDKSRQWTTRELDKHIGRSWHSLGKYLRDKLLICTNDVYWFGTHGSKCKEYRLNHRGYEELTAQFKINNNNYSSATQVTTGLEWFEKQYAKELESGAWSYTSKSNRLWNPAQQYPNTIRKQAFARQGYVWEYDIVSAAPTLITELAKRSGLEKPIPVIEAYLADPNKYRQALAEDLHITPRVAKQLILMRFAGARMGPYGSIIKQLPANSTLHYQRLKDNEFYNSITKEIKHLWDAIKQDLQLESRLTARDKWFMFFEQEAQVMKVVRKQLNKTGMKYFLEHDGWRCSHYIDENSLRLCVRKCLGIRVKFEVEQVILDSNDS
jgi:hypothetical protein